MRNIQRIRSLATTPMTFTAANTYIGQVGELVSVFDDDSGAAVALRIHDGNTIGGLHYYQINSYVPSSDPNAPNQDGVDNIYTGIPSGWLTDNVIDYSAYFDGTNYLSRNFGSGGSTTTWTFSFWYKREKINETHSIFIPTVSGDESQFHFRSNNDLRIYDDGGPNFNASSPGLFVDASSWGHVIVVLDSTNSTQKDRIQMYHNGNKIEHIDPGYGTNMISSGYSAKYNTNVSHQIGGFNGSSLFRGHMANVQFIDGAALDPSYFGETVEGNWIHRPYDGTSIVEGATPVSGLSGNDIYGTNGFYLNFADESNLGKDVSGNGNNFTVGTV